MKPATASVINAPAYQHYRSRIWKRWIIEILFSILILIILFSLTFNSTIKAQEAAGGTLSLDAQTALFKQIVNPVSIILAAGFLLLTASTATHYLRQRGISEQYLKTTPEIIDPETYASAFGPAFINIGIRNILILKNYQGFLRILRPVHPTQKNLFFLSSAEKVDQTINLQSQLYSIPINCRTRDGIQVIFPTVQIEYRFLVKAPSNDLRPSSNTANDLGIIKTYLLQKGNLSEQEIIRNTLDLVFSQILREFSLDELNGETPSTKETFAEEKIIHQLEAIKRYKINALSKHWRNRHNLIELFELSKKKRRKTNAGRAHQKQRHHLQKGIFLSVIGYGHWDASPAHSFPILEEKIKTALKNELLKFNILLITFQLSNWQPAEELVRQKISQNQGKKAELLFSQKELDNRQVQAAARQAYLDMLHGHPILSSSNYGALSSSILSQLSSKVKEYRIPPSNQ